MGIKSEEILKRVEIAPVGVLIFSGDLEVIFLNDTFKRIAGYYHLKYPEDNLRNDLLDLDILREELNSLSAGYSFEKEIKSINTPGIGKISLMIKGIPFFEGEKFSGGVLTAEDIRISSGEDIINNRFRLLEAVKTSGDYLFITDKNGQIRFSSGRKYFSGVIYQNINEIFNDVKLKIFEDNFREAGLSRYSKKFITSILLDQDEYECRVDPLLNEEGNPEYFLVTFNEAGKYIKENLQLKQNLQNSERFRAVADNADEMIYLYDREFQLNYSNRKAENLPDIAEQFNKYDLLNKLNNHPKYSTELEVGGKIFYAVFTKSGEDLITCFCREITSEKNELKRIKESEELLRNITSGADYILLNVNPEGNILYSNKYFREVFDTPKNFQAILGESFQYNFSIPLTKKDFTELKLISYGRQVDYSCSFNPVYSTEGEVLYITITGFNISSVKEDKQELQFFKDLFNAAGDGIAIIKNSRILQVNKSFASLFGYNTEEDLNGKPLHELSHSEEKNKIVDYIREVSISGFSSEFFEFTGKKMDGSQFYVSASLAPFKYWESSMYTILICRDVTERRKVQKAIRESEEKFRNLTENIDDFLFTYERSENVQRPVFYTASVEKITGYTQDEFLADSRLMFKVIHPDDLQQVKRKLKLSSAAGCRVQRNLSSE
jgi:PAS domain S-box-containing protein